MDELTITISLASGGDYQYDIYSKDLRDNLDDYGHSDDGGVCTSTLLNALDMAHDQARALITKTTVRTR